MLTGKFVPTCDICNKKLSEHRNVYEACSDMYHHRWLNGKIGDHWINWCDDCIDLAKNLLMTRKKTDIDAPQLKDEVVREGRKENIPGVAEGSMAELYLLSVDPDDEMGGL